MPQGLALLPETLHQHTRGKRSSAESGEKLSSASFRSTDYWHLFIMGLRHSVNLQRKRSRARHLSPGHTQVVTRARPHLFRRGKRRPTTRAPHPIDCTIPAQSIICGCHLIPSQPRRELCDSLPPWMNAWPVGMGFAGRRTHDPALEPAQNKPWRGCIFKTAS